MKNDSRQCRKAALQELFTVGTIIRNSCSLKVMNYKMLAMNDILGIYRKVSITGD